MLMNSSLFIIHFNPVCRNGDGNVVAEVPYILGVHIDFLSPVGVDGEVIVVALVEDEADVTGESAFLFIVEEFYLVEIYADIDAVLAFLLCLGDGGLYIGRNALAVFATQKFDATIASELSLEGVGGALLLHDVDIVWDDAHADGLTYLKVLVVLYQELATLVALGKHLVVYALEDGRGDFSEKFL